MISPLPPFLHPSLPPFLPLSLSSSLPPYLEFQQVQARLPQVVEEGEDGRQGEGHCEHGYVAELNQNLYVLLSDLWAGGKGGREGGREGGKEGVYMAIGGTWYGRRGGREEGREGGREGGRACLPHMGLHCAECRWWHKPLRWESRRRRSGWRREGGREGGRERGRTRATE